MSADELLKERKMTEFEQAVQYRRLAHAVRCYLAAEAETDFWQRAHWRDQVVKVLDRETTDVN